MHAGGVIRDASIYKQTLQQFREVNAAKVASAHQISDLGWAQSLQAEINFSSLSALLGTAGQSSYAAANLALNEFSRRKQHEGRFLY